MIKLSYIIRVRDTDSLFQKKPVSSTPTFASPTKRNSIKPKIQKSSNYTLRIFFTQPIFLPQSPPSQNPSFNHPYSLSHIHLLSQHLHNHLTRQLLLHYKRLIHFLQELALIAYFLHLKPHNLPYQLLDFFLLAPGQYLRFQDRLLSDGLTGFFADDGV